MVEADGWQMVKQRGSHRQYKHPAKSGKVTIAGHLLEIFKSLVPANDLEFRYGVNAPTLRIEGLTLGGR